MLLKKVGGETLLAQTRKSHSPITAQFFETTHQFVLRGKKTLHAPPFTPPLPLLYRPHHHYQYRYLLLLLPHDAVYATITAAEHIE